MINGKRNIAVVGLNNLESIGIRYLIHEEEEANVETYAGFAAGLLDVEKDAYVVSSEIFTANLDFFLPRKQKTLVVAGHLPSNNAGGASGLISVGADVDEVDLKKSVSSLFESLSEVEPQHGNLSAREIEVLKLIASGLINKEIADKLCISINTVITHRKNISSKLGIKSASGLSLYAVMNGII